MAVIGIPAVTVPTRGIFMPLPPVSLMALFWLFPFSRRPFAVRLFIYLWAVEVDLKPNSAQISLTVGG